eukprot:993091-Karenia_brevis.AAC.1
MTVIVNQVEVVDDDGIGIGPWVEARQWRCDSCTGLPYISLSTALGRTLGCGADFDVEDRGDQPFLEQYTMVPHRHPANDLPVMSRGGARAD